MSGRPGRARRVRLWLRSRERALAAGWLLGTAALLLLLVFRPTRLIVLSGLQSAVDRWESRWTRRLAEGEGLLARGDTAAAERFLARLDLDFPARDVRHALDMERERLLLHLARAQEALGKPDLAVATLERLVAFDSLNHLNHFALAQARLRAGDSAATQRAYASFTAVLRLNPAHLPSVRGVIRYHAGRNDAAAVVKAYEDYLDAVLVNPLTIRIGNSTVSVPAEIDGLARSVSVRGLCVPECRGPLEIQSDGFSLAVDSVVLVPARRVGEAAALPEIRLATNAVRTEDFDSVSAARFRARSPEATLSYELPPAVRGGVVQLTIGYSAYKPVDEELWSLVQRHFERLGSPERLARAERRSVPQPTAEAADRVLSRLGWVTEGRLLKGNERAF